MAIAAGLELQDVALAGDNGKRILQCRVLRNGVVVNSTLVGGAWEKLGFVQGVVRQIHSAEKTYDLTQSPAILVSFDNIPNAFRSKYGQYSFAVPNTSSFGSRIYYSSPVDSSCQRVKFPYTVTVDRLQMRLSNCDLKKLETVRGNAETTNQQGSEFIFVFTIRKKEK